jgi:hypothetical protein
LLAEVLRRVLPAGSEKRIFSLELVQLRWADLVGRELALRSEPVHLEEGVLTVRVSDAAWGRMILKLESAIRPRLRATLGPDVVKRIRFVKDGKSPWGSGRPPGVSKDRETEDRPVDVSEPIVEAARDIEDSDLRSLVVRTASRYLRASAYRRR